MNALVQCQRVSYELWPVFLTSILQLQKESHALRCAECQKKNIYTVYILTYHKYTTLRFQQVHFRS